LDSSGPLLGIPFIHRWNKKSLKKFDIFKTGGGFGLVKTSSWADEIKPPQNSEKRSSALLGNP